MNSGILIVDIGGIEPLFQINDSFEAVFPGTYGNSGLRAVRKCVKAAARQQRKSRFFLAVIQPNGKSVGAVDQEIDFERNDAVGLLAEFACQQRVKFRIYLDKIKLCVGGTVF